MHLFLRTPTKTCMPTSANIQIKNIVKISTSHNILMEARRVFTIVRRPGETNQNVNGWFSFDPLPNFRENKNRSIIFTLILTGMWWF